VKMAKVNWMARSNHEFIPNYKLLQAAFDRNHHEFISCHIPRPKVDVDVDKLSRAKYRDHFEFLQWMRAVWDVWEKPVGYDAISARGGRPVPDWASERCSEGGSSTEMGSTRWRQKYSTPEVRAPVVFAVDPTCSRRMASRRFRPESTVRTRNAPRAGTRRSAAPPALSSSEAEELKAKVMEQEEDIEEHRSDIEVLENERAYYFKKLCHMKILCETLQAKMDPALDVAGFISEVQGILYAENDEVPEEQNVSVAGGLSLEGP